MNCGSKELLTGLGFTFSNGWKVVVQTITSCSTLTASADATNTLGYGSYT
jgi:hypothetical protein